MLNEMSNQEIDNMFGNITAYLGCYAKDDLPASVWKRKGFIILNLDDKTGGGTHWTLMILGPQNYYIDSFGFPPPMQIDRGFKKTGRKTFYSDIQLQDKNTSSCGWFCSMFAIECVLKNRPVLDVLLNDFTYNPKENEKRLLQYYIIFNNNLNKQ